MAALIEPDARSVIEFGAWTMALRERVPRGCMYTPSDVYDRGSGTFVCDLNAKTLPDFPPHDVAVFGGVLEYVEDLPRLLGKLSNAVTTILASYAPAEGRLANPAVRGENNWVNAYTTPQLLDLFSRAGFTYVKVVGNWGKQILIRAERW